MTYQELAKTIMTTFTEEQLKQDVTFLQDNDEFVSTIGIDVYKENDVLDKGHAYKGHAYLHTNGQY